MRNIQPKVNSENRNLSKDKTQHQSRKNDKIKTENLRRSGKMRYYGEDIKKGVASPFRKVGINSKTNPSLKVRMLEMREFEDPEQRRKKNE
jgi:hypothetical protein